MLLPLADRYIPIITDEYPDPDFGSGAVKITGAHDFNDYKVARAHNIPLYVLMDTKGRMADAEHVPAKYRGLDRFEARKQVVADIEAIGLLDRVEDKKISQPFGDRSNVVIEPMLTDQWYVNAGEMAKSRDRRGRNRQDQVRPGAWTKTYFQWMRNIEPWCVSRQLWWGHRIPAWYGPDEHVFVEESEDAAKSAATKHYGKDVALRQDEDVLDTWFSSGALAVLDARLAGEDGGAEEILSDVHARHRARHHLLLGRAHDDDGHALHEGSAVRRSLHPRPGARRQGPEDVEVQGQHDGPVGR